MHKKMLVQKSLFGLSDGRQFAALGGEPVGRLAPAGPLDTSGPNDLSGVVAPEIRAGRGDSRARVPGSQPVAGVDAPPSRPPTPAI